MILGESRPPAPRKAAGHPLRIKITAMIIVSAKPIDMLS